MSITPADLPLPDWTAVHEPTQDRAEADVDLTEAHPDVAEEVRAG